ncbi:MAG: hypothetical protein IPG63_15225 [Xanthomonadales bacterium]|nr:hypothetical protein [Xanthomonadales bacterium]
MPAEIGTITSHPGHLGRTFHPKDQKNPNPGEYTVQVNDTFLEPLERAGLDDLLEALVHESMHVAQPDSAWTEPNPEKKRAFHEELTHDAANTAIDLRDKFHDERRKWKCD